MDPNPELTALLAELNPELQPGEYAFCRVPTEAESACMAIPPLATFWEAEGLSVVVLRSQADAHGLDYDSVHRCITLTVHSSLTAVGLTAAVSGALAAHGMSANVIAAFAHDHIFVPAEDAQRAFTVIQSLSGTH